MGLREVKRREATQRSRAFGVLAAGVRGGAERMPRTWAVRFDSGVSMEEAFRRRGLLAEGQLVLRASSC